MKEYFEIPKICPICHQPTEIRKANDSITLWCSNSQCSGKLINRINKFFGKDGLDAKGISKATIEKLISWGWINSISDVFLLPTRKTEWENKDGFGVKSVSNILSSLQQSSNTVLESVISAAGIPLIGRTVARDLASKFNSYDSFREAIINKFDFSEFNGYGYEMSKAILNFDYSELDYIVKNYLTIEKNNDIINIQKLKDLTFCITGKLSIYKNRDEITKVITDLGGKVVGSVSKNVNYLINNDIESTSSKNKKAKDLGIPIISEENFLKIFDL